MAKRRQIYTTSVCQYIYIDQSTILPTKQNKNTPTNIIECSPCQPNLPNPHRSCGFLGPTNRNPVCFFKYLGPVQRSWIWTLLPRKERTHILALVCSWSFFSPQPTLFRFIPHSLYSNVANIVRQAHLGNLRAKNYQGSDDEWAQIVSYIFGYYSTSTSKPDWSTGIEVSASISSSGGDEDREIVLTIRKRIQAITVCSFMQMLTFSSPPTKMRYSKDSGL